MQKPLLAAVFLLFTGCLDEATPTYTIEIEDGIVTSELTAQQCSSIEGGGACAVACIPEELTKFVPEDSCKTFTCSLAGSSSINLDVCTKARPTIDLEIAEEYGPPSR